MSRFTTANCHTCSRANSRQLTRYPTAALLRRRFPNTSPRKSASSTKGARKMTISSVMWGASSIWAEMVVSFRLVWLDTTSLVRRYTSSFRPYRATSPMAMNLQAPPRFSAKCREVRPRKPWKMMTVAAKRM